MVSLFLFSIMYFKTWKVTFTIFLNLEIIPFYFTPIYVSES